jgi:hypothetical protein
MTSERIKEIQQQTAYPDSISVQQALLQVWNECSQLPQQEISDGVIPPNSFILSLNREEPIIIIDEEGFKYKGELIKDSGEIYKLFKEFLQTSLLPQQEISDEEIQAEAIKRSSKYQDSALFENTWEEAIEWYKEKLQLLK